MNPSQLRCIASTRTRIVISTWAREDGYPGDIREDRIYRNFTQEGMSRKCGGGLGLRFNFDGKDSLIL